MIAASASFNAPLAIRYPKECKRVFESSSDFELTKWEYLTHGNCGIAVLACGERAIDVALAANGRLGNGLSVTVVNARCVKPLDKDFIENLNENIIVTVEDNQLLGGFGSSICSYFADNVKVRVKNFAYSDTFIPHGTVEELMDEFGLNCSEITKYILKNAVR